jgi:hypothetical protein
MLPGGSLVWVFLPCDPVDLAPGFLLWSIWWCGCAIITSLSSSLVVQFWHSCCSSCLVNAVTLVVDSVVLVDSVSWKLTVGVGGFRAGVSLPV